jgi:excisionase family DNA binding protein
MTSEPRTTNDERLLKDVLTPVEAAHYLSLHIRTLYRLARNGEIPGRKVGGSWRFKKDTLDEWLSGTNLPPASLPKMR